MTKIEEILKLHKKWLMGEPEGKKANLQYADLRYANLSGADLRYADLRHANLKYTNLKHTNLEKADLRFCIGNNKEIKSLKIGIYHISYTKDILNIGCKSYTIEEWKSFTDDEIKEMGKNALKWWNLNKHIIFELVEREQKR